LKNPHLLPDGYFLAKDGSNFVGMSDVHRIDSEPAVLNQDDTGVIREYRGRGIATALKLRVIDFGKKNGYRIIKTWNDSVNASMLAINNKLGFKRQVGWILMEKISGQNPARDGNLWADLAFRKSASRSRFFGFALVSSECRKRPEAWAISSMAAVNERSFAFEGWLKPLIFRTNCSEAARISSSVAGGSKLNRGRIFLHIPNTSECSRVYTESIIERLHSNRKRTEPPS